MRRIFSEWLSNNSKHGWISKNQKQKLGTVQVADTKATKENSVQSVEVPSPFQMNGLVHAGQSTKENSVLNVENPSLFQMNGLVHAEQSTKENSARNAENREVNFSWTTKNFRNCIHKFLLIRLRENFSEK